MTLEENHEELHALLCSLDADGNGFLDISEIQVALARLRDDEAVCKDVSKELERERVC